MLLPQDVLVALKLAVSKKAYTYAELANALNLSASQVHSAVKRCDKSGLVKRESMRSNRGALCEFLIHGAKYAYPPISGKWQRGMPTAHSASPLRSHISSSGEPVVWPDPEGEMRGEALHPLHKSVPHAARKDPHLYQALALLDAIRSGRARERDIAAQLLAEILA